MNKYLINLDKVEFVITDACSGRCKHCSQGQHTSAGGHIDSNLATKALRAVAESYNIKTVMTFGGEPLLYPDVVCDIHAVANSLGVAKRQLITNGFFSVDRDYIKEIAYKISSSGINDILLSIDAYHQENIPVDYPMLFVDCLLESGVTCVRTQPAWLVDKNNDNKYNAVTRGLLDDFMALGIYPNDGNVIFPAGNALLYFKEYFDYTNLPSDPYVEDLFDIHTLSFNSDGSVLTGNIYSNDIIDIIESYDPVNS